MILNKNKLFLLVFLILSILPVLSLFHPGLPLTHDGQDHVARIANFYQNLTEGNLIPRWAGNLNWGYGHPILEFLYPLPSYIASFFHFVGFSLVDSVKIVFALGMILSMVFMYLWISQFSSKYSALFGAVLYTYAPYRFVDLYVRGDIGENLAFAFIPFALFFIYRVYKNNKFLDTILGAIALAFLILSHNGISLMFMPFILIYAIMLIYFSKDRSKISINLFFVFVMGLGMSAFFWFPGVLEGKYTLRNIVTKGAYANSFAAFKSLIYGPWNYGGSGQFTVQFGLFQWLGIIVSPFLIFKLKENKRKCYLLIILFLYTILAVFLVLPISNFLWSKIMLLQNFQFPWRFLAIVIFSGSVLAALVLDEISKKYTVRFAIFAIALVVFISSFYWHPKDYLHKPESFYTGIYYSTTDTGESAPIWSVRFMEKIPRAHFEVIDGDAYIKELKRTSTYHKYQLIVNKPTLFEENTLYFPGWEIKANGIPQDIEFQNKDYKGIMTFHLSKGSYVVEAIYKETKLRLFADVISLVSFGNILGGLLLLFLIKAKYKN